MSYASGYAAGRSSGISEGKRRGRAEAYAAVDKAEAKCVAAILSENSAFRKGISDAQDYVNNVYERRDLENIVNDEAVEVDFRSWKTLWLTKNKANPAHEAKVEDDAKDMLVRHFLKASAALPEERISAIAYHTIRNEQEQLGIAFDRGYAAQMVAGLNDEDYHRIGFIGHLFNMAANIRGMDAGNIAESSAGPSGNEPSGIPNYEEFLEKALEQTGEQVAAHIVTHAEKSYRDAVRRQRSDFNGPAL